MIQKSVLLAVCLTVFFAYVDRVDGALSDVTYQTYGLNFSPYIDDDEDPNKGGDQITDEELCEKMEIIASYTQWIRTFGCNKDLKEAGIFAHEIGLKAAVGAWLGREPQAQQENRNQIDCLKAQAKAGHVGILPLDKLPSRV